MAQLGDSVAQLGDGATRRWGQTQNYKRLNMFRLDLCVRGKGFLNKWILVIPNRDRSLYDMQEKGPLRDKKQRNLNDG